MERNQPAEIGRVKFDFVSSKNELDQILEKLKATLKSSLLDGAKEECIVEKLQAKLKSCQFSVAIMALIKCGKSTLGNALLTAPLLPVDEKPQTQTIVRIWHNPTLLQLKENDQIVATDPASVEKHLRAINSRILASDKAENLKLDLYAGLHCLGDRSLDGISFQVLDTPGPNDEGVTHLKGKIETLLREVDAIIYLLDATKLRSTDEERLLKQIPHYLLKSAAERIFVVVNKWEPNVKDPTKRKQQEEADRKYVLDMLTKFLPTKEDGQCWIPEDHVLLLSARKAYYARGFIGKTLSDMELEYFKGMVDPSGAFLPEIPQEYLQSALAKSAQTFLKESLIEAFEQRIVSHTFNRSGYLLLSSVKDQIEALLNEQQNTLNMMHSALKKEKIDPSVLEEIKAEIRRVQEEFSGIKTVMRRYVLSIRVDFESEAQKFKTKIKNQLRAAFSPGGTVAEASASIGKIRSVLANLRLVNKDHAQVIKVLKELNAEIQKTIDAQFKEWQTKIEQIGIQLQVELNKLLRDQSAPLLKKVQQKIGKLFDFQFALTNIALAPQQIISPHDSESFINTKTSRVIVPKQVESTEDVTEYREESGCFGKSKVPVVKKQKKLTIVNEERHETVHETDEKKVEARWAEYVDRRLEIVITEAMNLLSPLLESCIEHYERTLMDYVGGYRQILEKEWEEKTKGQKHVEDRIREVKEMMSRTLSLISDLSSVMNPHFAVQNEAEPISQRQEQSTDLLSAIRAFDKTKLRTQERIERMEKKGFEEELKLALQNMRQQIEPDIGIDDTEGFN